MIIQLVIILTIIVVILIRKQSIPCIAYAHDVCMHVDDIPWMKHNICRDPSPSQAQRASVISRSLISGESPKSPRQGKLSLQNVLRSRVFFGGCSCQTEPFLFVFFCHVCFLSLCYCI